MMNNPAKYFLLGFVGCVNYDPVVTASIINMERKSGEVFERLFVELNINI